MHILVSTRWWLQYSGPCHSHGRPWLRSQLLDSGQLIPGNCGHLGSKLADQSSFCLCVSLLFCLPLKTKSIIHCKKKGRKLDNSLQLLLTENKWQNWYRIKKMKENSTARQECISLRILLHSYPQWRTWSSGSNCLRRVGSVIHSTVQVSSTDLTIRRLCFHRYRESIIIRHIPYSFLWGWN